MRFSRNALSATISPLSSIFGSGFLVIAPILAGAVGGHAVLAMGGICAFAFVVGEVIRFNIRHAEPFLAAAPRPAIMLFERVSDLALIIAYVISVCLYVKILSAFALRGLDADNALTMNALTTVIITAIVVIGVTRGLKTLDRLETWALVATFLIIALLVIGFIRYDIAVLASAGGYVAPARAPHGTWEIATILAGALIVVQGFETPRYLGDMFPADVRVRASRWSQIISSVVYLVFVAVTLPVLHTLGGVYDDNSLVALVAVAASALALPLIAAAALSQFSAAVADTHAAVGSMEEMTRGWLSPALGCLIVGAAAILLTWSADTLEILAIASRAFAFYYCLQCCVAFCAARRFWQRAVFAVLAGVLAGITVFAVPVG